MLWRALLECIYYLLLFHIIMNSTITWLVSGGRGGEVIGSILHHAPTRTEQSLLWVGRPTLLCCSDCVLLLLVCWLLFLQNKTCRESQWVQCHRNAVSHGWAVQVSTHIYLATILLSFLPNFLACLFNSLSQVSRYSYQAKICCISGEREGKRRDCQNILKFTRFWRT